MTKQHKSPNITGCACIARKASEIRKLWPNPQDHKVPNPLPIVAATMLSTARKDLDNCVKATAAMVDAKGRLETALGEYQSATDQFLRNFYLARKTVWWMTGEVAKNGKGLSVKDLAFIMKSNPEIIYNALVRTIGTDYLAAMQRTKECLCPVCGQRSTGTNGNG
jgi:hypothetical protein